MEKEEDVLIVQKELITAFGLTTTANRNDWLAMIAGHINYLVTSDFSKLVFMLYRLDVDERKLKQTLQENPGEQAGMLIARLVVQRQLQKRASRAQWPRQTDIPDDEKW